MRDFSDGGRLNTFTVLYVQQLLHPRPRQETVWTALPSFHRGTIPALYPLPFQLSWAGLLSAPAFGLTAHVPTRFLLLSESIK